MGRRVGNLRLGGFWGTLLLEFSIGILVWNRRLRPWVLGVGVLMHTGIMATMAVGFFSPSMFVLYLAFIPPDTARRLVGKLRRSGEEQQSGASETNGHPVVPVGALPGWGDVVNFGFSDDG
jgi:hypothetical protein